MQPAVERCEACAPAIAPQLLYAVTAHPQSAEVELAVLAPGGSVLLSREQAAQLAQLLSSPQSPSGS